MHLKQSTYLEMSRSTFLGGGVHSSLEFLKVHRRTVCACALAATVERNGRRKEEALLQVLAPRAQHTWQVWM